MHALRFAIAFAVLFGLTPSVFAASAELDFFTVPFSVTGGPGAGIWETEVDSPVGPYAMERTVSPPVIDESALGSMQGGGGVVTATVPVGSTSPIFVLAYDVPVGTLDLSSFDSFALHIEADEPFAYFNIYLVAQVPGTPPPGGRIYGARFTSQADVGGLVKMPFSSILAGTESPDFANIISVEFQFQLSEPGTVKIRPATIPEPSSLALFLVGLLGLASLRRAVS
jgi:hypothetical protein